MTTDHLIAPHGGTLVDLLVSESDREKLVDESKHFPKVVVSPRELSDLEMLAVGALSPLTGFQGEAECHSILDSMHLENGLPWTIPVTSSLSAEEAKRIGGADAVTLLLEEEGAPLAILEVSEVFRRDREKEARAVFGTLDAEDGLSGRLDYRIVETGAKGEMAGINGGIVKPDREGPWPGNMLFYVLVDDLAALLHRPLPPDAFDNVMLEAELTGHA